MRLCSSFTVKFSDRVLDYPTPWRGRFWNYEECGGMRAPLDGEVAWLQLEGTMRYWRGRITEIAYEFAQ
jgi:hypothetical protein